MEHKLFQVKISMVKEVLILRLKAQGLEWMQF